MKRPLLIGITGGIGSGKSIACKVFRTFGIPTYDADSRARWLMNHDEHLRAEVKGLFGVESYKNGELDRTYIGQRAFHSPELLEKLNSLVHPAVAKDFETWVQDNLSHPYLVKEAALLFETGSYTQLDQTVLVTAPEDVRIARVLKRDPHRTRQDVEAIMARQMDEEAKKKLADHVLVNDGQHMLLPQILELHEGFTR